jgi:hypothetical protein
MEIIMRINIDFYEFSELRNQYLALINELEAYRKNQIELILNGKRSSPVEIATACMVQEEGSYMRDYIGNEIGKVVEVRFDRIGEV